MLASCKIISSKAPFQLRVSNEVCLKLPVIGLPAVADDKMHAFILDLIYGITCLKHGIILEKCCLLHGGEKKK